MPPLVPLLAGWLGFAAFAVLSPSSPLWLIPVIAVILLAALGVLHHAEKLAHILGDPFGTLVLTLSIVGMEVTLLAAVLFGPGEHATVARDSTMAAAMLFLGLFFGAALLIGTLRHGPLEFNERGVSAYLTMLVVFGSLTFALPGFIGVGGSFTPAQAVVVVVLTAGSYVFFLWRQMTGQAADFREVVPVEAEETTAGPAWRHAVLLLLTAAPIVLLSHDMASLLDAALAPTAAPAAVSGMAIAMIVMFPEGFTTLRAAWNGEIQRVYNLTYGAMVSVVGLTVPTVLTIGLLTGQRIVFAESPVNLMLLATLALLAVAVLAGRKVTPLHGLAHLVLAAVYLLSVFSG